MSSNSGRSKHKYGDKPTWTYVVEAVEALGGIASAKQVDDYLKKSLGDYKNSTSVNLHVCSVNCDSRANWPFNKNRRRTDDQESPYHKYDRLFKRGVGKSSTFELYQPALHGVWELFNDDNGKWATRLVADAVEQDEARQLQAIFNAAVKAAADLIPEEREQCLSVFGSGSDTEKTCGSGKVSADYINHGRPCTLFNLNKIMSDEMIEMGFDEAQEEEITISPTDNSIYTSSGDPEIESLYQKQKRGRLVLQPDFQRQYVWDSKKASKLMESSILSIPLPIIYLSEEKDGKEYVIDGQQRLTSFFSFIDGNFPDGKAFKLTGLNVLADLNGKKFSDLSEEQQDKIRYYKVRAITFLKNSSEDLKFEIFERLNTGSVQLNDQELRNCLYRGPFNKALKEMSEDPDFMFICGFESPDKRMKDIELVLRFCAFYHKTYLNYKSTIRSFLNQEAQERRNISDGDLQELKAAFKNACHIIKSMFGENSFKRFYKGNENQPNGYWTNQFNASLFDILMYSFSKEDKNKVFQNLDSIREALINLMTEDQEFIDSILLSTSSVQAITKRFDKWRTVLQGILGVQQKEPRCFSFKLKEDMMGADPTCAICQQRIQLTDDAAIDHVKQYWTGGRTIPENARLTHRYCNWARPRSESA